MCCLFGSKKKKDHALHFEEVEKYYPQEYSETFSKLYPYVRKTSTLRRPGPQINVERSESIPVPVRNREGE